MALDETRLLAFANVASALPLSDIVAAAQDPTNLGKVAAAIEDIIAALPAPPLTGLAADLAFKASSIWSILREVERSRQATQPKRRRRQATGGPMWGADS